MSELLISEGCSHNLKARMGNTPLHDAVRSGREIFVELLLSSGVDINIVDEDGKTALHVAAEMNSLSMVEMLMEKASPELLNVADTKGKTAFVYACCYGNDALISYFLNQSCDIHVTYRPLRDTPLLGSLSNINITINAIKMLLCAGADVNATNCGRETPLIKAFHAIRKYAFRRSFLEDAICLFIDKGCDVNVVDLLGFTPMHHAVCLNSEVVVRKLLNSGFLLINEINLFGYNPLQFACQNGMHKIASLLVNNGADLRQFLNRISGNSVMFSDEKHRSPDSVLNYVIKKAKECPNLKNLCRQVIRKSLRKDIDKRALQLPLPNHLIKFICRLD